MGLNHALFCSDKCVKVQIRRRLSDTLVFGPMKRFCRQPTLPASLNNLLKEQHGVKGSFREMLRPHSDKHSKVKTGMAFSRIIQTLDLSLPPSKSKKVMIHVNLTSRLEVFQFREIEAPNWMSSSKH